MLHRRIDVRFARYGGDRLESSSGSGLSLDKEPDMSVLDLVQQNLGPAEIQQLSEQIGADPARTQQAVQAAVPMLLGGMASTAQQPDGARTVAAAAQQHAGLLGGVGGALGGILGGGGGGSGGGLGSVLGGVLGDAGGGGLLGKILGHQQTAVQDGVQQASGLDSSQVRKLLMVLAPIVLAAFAQHRKQQQQQAGAAAASADLNNDGIPDALQQEARQAQAQTQRSAPHIGGLVGKILDAATRH
jgi:hypothetical protein